MVKVGFGLPCTGQVASNEGIKQVATRAEELGYQSLWTWDRMFWATDPQNEYPGAPGQSHWPDYFKGSIDPLTVLTVAAAHTERVDLGTSILVFGHYHPVSFARSVATLDVISNGRLKLGFGSGWSIDEHQAMGVEFGSRGQRAAEFLQVFKGLLAPGPFAFDGEFFSVPENIMQDSVQQPHPPILLAGNAPVTLRRAARQADGWTPVGIPIDQMGEMHQSALEMVKEAGGNPETFQLSVRANFAIFPEPLEERWPFMGSLDQIKEDYEASVAAGATEIFFDPGFGPNGATLEGFLESMETIKETIG